MSGKLSSAFGQRLTAFEWTVVFIRTVRRFSSTAWLVRQRRIDVRNNIRRYSADVGWAHCEWQEMSVIKTGCCRFVWLQRLYDFFADVYAICERVNIRYYNCDSSSDVRHTNLLLARLHIVYGGQTSNSRWRLSSSVFCRLSSFVTPHMQRNSSGAARDGGPVVLRFVRATACLLQFCLVSHWFSQSGRYIKSTFTHEIEVLAHRMSSDERSICVASKTLRITKFQHHS